MMCSKDIIIVGPFVLGELALIIKFNLQTGLVIYINMTLVCEAREQNFLERHEQW